MGGIKLYGVGVVPPGGRLGNGAAVHALLRGVVHMGVEVLYSWMTGV